MRGRSAFLFSLAAVGWSVLLLVGAFTFPVYGTEDSSGAAQLVNGKEVVVSAQSSSGSATLVDENGTGVLLVTAVPLVVVLLGAWLLHRYCSRGSRWADSLAWALIVVLTLFSLIASASIGLFMLPAVLLLGISAALTRPPLAVPLGA
jgi:hypothetical protein